ncbi:MAG: ABC transporter [Leptolyngbyaceae cyanobacterium SL_1_1]|nr:ABC transporter [Leptolyngbyaceae cyanobacterium RM1_1_2]NJO08680.1 ABC transporter [Leptolyngbyaceae cyanobacterium SL_1_1]
MAGLGLAVLGAWFGSRGLEGFWQQRSTQVGTNALLATAAVLVILALINFLAVRYSARLDLTENQLFTLAPQSEQVVQTLSQPVKVLIFDVAPNPQDQQLLKSYQRQNPDQFSYEYVNPYEQPVLSQQFGVQTPGEVYLTAGDRRQLVQRLNESDRLSERQLTNQLDRLGSDREATVYFLQGHGEYVIDGTKAGLFEAAQSLEEKNYTVKPLNLAAPETETEDLESLLEPDATEPEAPAAGTATSPENPTAAPADSSDQPQIPEDASVVIIAGPQQALFEAEIQALETYLAQGGNALVMVDPNTRNGLDNFLASWGVAPTQEIVLDNSGAGQLVGLGPAAPIVSDYGNHPITQEFGGGRSFYPVVQPLEITEVPNVTATPLLITGNETQAQTISDEGELQFDPAQAPQGPFVVGVALTRPAQTSAALLPDSASRSATGEAGAEGADEADEADDTDAPAETRMVVLGNSSFASDGLFQQQLNGDVFLNSISWLGQQADETLSIRPKEVTRRRILMTPTQQISIAVFACLILPLIAIVGAVVMWLRRR